MKLPLVAGINRRRHRPAVVFPQPLSPTRPSVSPRLHVETNPVHGFDITDGALEDPFLDREVFSEVVHLKQFHFFKYSVSARFSPPLPSNGWGPLVENRFLLSLLRIWNFMIYTFLSWLSLCGASIAQRVYLLSVMFALIISSSGICSHSGIRSGQRG